VPWPATVLIVLGLAAGAVAIATLVRIRRAARTERLERADAIVVFGAAVWRGEPSPTLRLRAIRGAALYAQGLAPVVVCSGGRSGGASEPRVMADVLLARGVPAAALVLDEEGRTTRATLASAKRLGARRILAVSSPFHVFRIVEEARRQGVEALPVPARRAPAAGAAALRLAMWDARQYAREVVAVWSYRAAARRARGGTSA
jgi:uncharacterized SAM-binding protein YcdF (DUF218 family)